MVFPSFAFQIETGLISQISTLALIGFSVFINFWKKLAVYSLIIISLLFAAKSAFAFAAYPGACGTMCVNNTNYFGTPYVRPVSIIIQTRCITLFMDLPLITLDLMASHRICLSGCTTVHIVAEIKVGEILRIIGGDQIKITGQLASKFCRST